MKATAADFLLATAALLIVLAGAIGLVAGFVAPFSAQAFGPYHVLSDALAFLLCFGLLAALASSSLRRIWPVLPGEYSMDDPNFRRWMLLTVLYEFGRGALLPFTTVFAKPLVEGLFGATVGKNTALGGRLADPYLVHIAESAVLDHNSVVTPHMITSGRIQLRAVRIGHGATVGVNVVVMAGAEIGEGSVVAAGSVVPPLSRIPSGELWGGIPARHIKKLEASDVRA
jgi:acetyltransferase-like isoleucine patch superfamily enzyme